MNLQPAIDKAMETTTNIRSILGAMFEDENVDSTQAIYQSLESFGFIVGYLSAVQNLQDIEIVDKIRSATWGPNQTSYDEVE